MIEVQKEYVQNNKEKIANYKQDWYEQHKAEKAICECGCEMLKRTLTRHSKSNKHIELMKQKEGN